LATENGFLTVLHVHALMFSHGFSSFFVVKFPFGITPAASLGGKGYEVVSPLG
jgi:hypothetical protein